MSRRRILLAELTPTIPGARVRAAWSEADTHPEITLSNGNLTAAKNTVHATNWRGVGARPDLPMVGQWYWETTVEFTGAPDFGIGTQLQLGDGYRLDGDPTATGASFVINRAGQVRVGGLLHASLGAIASGTVIRHWFDCDSRRYRVAVGNGNWCAPMVAPGRQGPFAGFRRPSGTTVSVVANFGQAAFVYAPPEGATGGLYHAGPATRTTLYLGSEALRTGPADTPANTYYEPRLARDRDLEIEREASCWVWGKGVSRAGQVVVVNADGALDGWAELNWRDAGVRLLSGWEGDAREDFELWSFAFVDQVEFASDSRIVLSLASPVSQLDRPLQPELYPSDQANSQAAGTPLPIVYGRPLYCEPVRLDPAPAARHYQVSDRGLDSESTPMTEILEVFDSGDRFAGPSDPYTPHNPVTAGNGGNFTGWTGTPAMPTGWTRVTGFGPNDKFVQASGGGLRCVSHHQPLTGIAHGVALQADRRYRISFQVAAVATPGVLVFHAGGREVPFAFATGMSGTHSVLLDTREAGALQLLMRGVALDASIRALRVESERLIDWIYRAAQTGFTLANTPMGKVCVNPRVGSASDLESVCTDLALRAGLLSLDPDGPDRVGFDGSSFQRVIGTSSWAGQYPYNYEVAAYYRTPVTALQVVRDLLDSWCGWVTGRRSGQLSVGKVIDPEAQVLADPDAVSAELDDSNILGSVNVETDRARNLTLRLGGARNHAVHRDSEIATGVPEALRTTLMSEWTQVAEAGEGAGAEAIAEAYPQAIGAALQGTWLRKGDELRTEADRVAALWRQERRFFHVTALLGASQADELEPGDIIRLTWPRWGLHQGRHLLVVGVRSRFFARRVDLKLWG